jgi:membrane-associated phospholipid phosphatase
MTIASIRALASKGALLLAAVVVCASPAAAQSGHPSNPGCSVAAGSWSQLFVGTFGNFRQLSSRQNLGIVALGGIAAASAHRADGEVTRSVAGHASSGAFKPGAFLGSTPLQLGAAIGTYAIGRALNKPCAASLGADLFQADLMAQALVVGLKQATRRARPEGSGYSFPSGHAAAAFASATVLQRHYGWKAGLPAYAVASYVAVSRVEMNRHYVSDVAFGAALGFVAGRTVTIGKGRQLMLTPITTPDSSGAGIGVTWLGKR